LKRTTNSSPIFKRLKREREKKEAILRKKKKKESG